jgi:predicted deacylase
MTKELPPFRTGQARTERGYVQPIEELSIPFGIVEGATPGPRLLVTAGVHASEYCSIETAVRLMTTDPSALRGTLVVLPILNIQGFASAAFTSCRRMVGTSIECSLASPTGPTSERLAHWLVTQVYPYADAYLDLHGGDLDESLTPFTIYPGACERSRELATAFGLPVAIASTNPGHTVSASSKLGVPSILPEVSGNGLWNESTVGEMMAGVERVMHHLGMIEGPVKALPSTAPEHVTMWVPAAPADGLWYPAKELMDPIAVGDVLGEIRDVFGTVLGAVQSEKQGFVVYRLTSLAVNRGEALLGVATPIQVS